MQVTQKGRNEKSNVKKYTCRGKTKMNSGLQSRTLQNPNMDSIIFNALNCVLIFNCFQFSPYLLLLVFYFMAVDYTVGGRVTDEW